VGLFFFSSGDPCFPLVRQGCPFPAQIVHYGKRLPADVLIFGDPLSVDALFFFSPCQTFWSGMGIPFLVPVLAPTIYLLFLWLELLPGF